MKTCVRGATGSTTQIRVDPRPLDVGDATPTAHRVVLYQHPPRPVAPVSYSPHIITCGWLALAISFGHAALELRLVAIRQFPVAPQLWFVESQPSDFALPPDSVAASLR